MTVNPATPPDPPQSDEFNGNELLPKWKVRARATPASRSRAAILRLQAYGGDMHGNNATASNVVLQDAPTDCGWTATTRIDLSELTRPEGGEQAGMVLWRSESPNNFSKIVYNRRPNNQWWVERSNTVNGSAQGTQNTAMDSIPQVLYLRVVAEADGTVQPERSLDGTTWTAVGAPYQVAGTGPLKVGLTYFSNDTLRRANFDWFRVQKADPCVPPPDPCPAATAPEAGFTRIWNGVDLGGWRQAGPGAFEVRNDGPTDGCRLLSTGGLGMLWYENAVYDEFVLRLQWKREDDDDNSGVFVRFPNPGNDHNVAINQGHEIQIREGTTGEPQKTGSIYNFDPIGLSGEANPPGEWNDYEIRYEDGSYTITLNGAVINTWENTSDQGRNPGYIGLQNHGTADAISFRDVRVQHLGDPPQPNLFTTIGITRSETRANSEIFGTPTRYSLPAEEMPPSGTVGVPPDDAADDIPLRMPDTGGEVPNLAAFRGQTLTLRAADQKAYSKIHLFGTTTDGGPAGGNFTLRFSDNTTQSINVLFRDWCSGAAGTPAIHFAIGPLSQRYRETGSDGAPCGIYHVPADVTAGKTLISVSLPPDTQPAGTNTQSYLMAVTLEEPDGGFEMPDLSGQLQFPDDQTPPVTTHALDPAAPGGEDGWYTQPVQVTLTAADETGGSGLREIQYRINGGTPQTYTAPFEVDDEGELELEYRAIDAAGNAETFKPVLLKVDGTAPVTTLTTSPETPGGANGWHDRAVQVTLTARDGDGSGIAATEIRLGGTWQPYTGPVMLSADQAHAIAYRSSDAAGNDEADRLATVSVDASAPTTAAQVASTAPAGAGVHRAPVTVTLASSDAGSGVAATEYRLDGGAWQAYGGPLTVSAAGGHLVEFRSRDRAGNLENAREVMFAISSTQAGIGPDQAPLPPQPFVGMSPLDRVSMAALARGGVRVRAVCAGVGRGTLKLTVTRKVAKRLGLGRQTTLAARSVRCGDEARISVLLKPSSKVKKALRRADGSFPAKLVLRMNGIDGPAADSESLTLRG